MIFVDQAAKTIPASDDAGRLRVRGGLGRLIRNAEIAATVWPGTVVMVNIGAKHGLQMSAPGDQQPVEALLLDRSDPPLRCGVRSWCPDRCANHVHAFGCKDAVEGTAELLVSIMDEELQRLLAFLEVEREIPGLLGNPVPVGVGRAAGDL